MNCAFLKNPINPATPDEDLSVGIPEIDEEHRLFFAHVAQLDEALSQRRDAAEIRRLVGLIMDTAIRHFAHEEQLFVQFGFPNVDQHSSVHAEIIADLLRLKVDCESDDFGVKCADVGRGLKDVLQNHVLEQDMKYRDFLYQYRLVPL